MQLVGWCLMAKQTIKQLTKWTQKTKVLFDLVFVEIVNLNRRPQRSLFSQSLASTDNLSNTGTHRKQNYMKKAPRGDTNTACWL